MKTKAILSFLFCAVIGMAGQCQNNSITKIEFTTLTRGYQKQVFISADSLVKIVEGRQDENKVQKRKLADGEWKELVNEAAKTPVTEIAQLKSPTSRRAFDGARHSTIVIHTKDGRSYTHSFDDENPHEKLKVLLDLIKNMEGDNASSGR